MQQQNISIGALVDQYKRGELRLPEIQRQYVWRAPRVRDLLDSLYRRYPSGSILLWETDETVPMKGAAIVQQPSAFTGHKLLLDGQQRLTSLTAVLLGELVTVRGQQKPIDIAFNLNHPEHLLSESADGESDDEDDDRTFMVMTAKLRARQGWVSVTGVFGGDTDAVILTRAGVTSLVDPNYQRYSDRLKKLRAIKDYPYVVHVLERNMSYEEVTEIFVRVNSLGANLRSSDLALAQMTSRWRDLLKELEDFQKVCEQSRFAIDMGQLVRSIVVFATQQCKFGVVGSTQLQKLKEGWEEGKEGLRFAINFLQANAGIEDESLLSSPMFLHTIAAISRVKDNKLSQADQGHLLHWLLNGNARGRFGRGASEGLLNEDLKVVFDKQDVAALLELLKRQFGAHLDIEPVDLEGRGVTSPVFSLAYLALKHAGAKDWHSGLGLSLAHQGRPHFIQWHHIFPKSLLKAYGYQTNEINEMANMAFIGGQTNQSIGNKAPSEYLGKIVNKHGKAALEAQCVPLDPTLWEIDRYRDFLRVRREELANRMNTFILKT